VELNADDSVTDDRVSAARQRGLSTLRRQAWVLEAGVAVVRSVVQDGEGVVKTSLINIGFNDCHLHICSMQRTHIPATVQISGVERVGIVRRGYFNRVVWSL
jgi:hypothetical protein